MYKAPQYPFSDLTSEQVDRLVREARREQAQTIRRFFAGLFSGQLQIPGWPPRRRESQIWPPKNVHALNLTAYR